MKWYLGAIALLVVGYVFSLGLLIYSMYVLLGVMLLSRALAHRWVEHVTVTRQCSRRTLEIGESAAVIVTVKNNDNFPVAWMLLEDSVPREALQQRPPRISLDGRRQALIQLPPRGEKSLRYKVEFLMRGYYQLGPVMLESGDLFGLHRRYRIATEPAFVLVYPKVVPLQSYDIASRRPMGEVRLTHRLFEDPTRISGVRPYEQGDPIRRIHWHATARTGELHSKTFEPSTVAGATILLDFHKDGYPSPQSALHSSELGITTAASLANAVSLLGEQVGFVSNGRDAADRIRTEGYRREFRTREAARKQAGTTTKSDRLRPVAVETRSGPEQLDRILQTLARLELTDGLTFPQLVLESMSRLPRNASVVAILGDASVETATTLGNLRRSGYAVTAVLVVFGNDDYSDAAGRLIAERIDVLRIEDEIAVSDLCNQHLV